MKFCLYEDEDGLVLSGIDQNGQKDYADSMEECNEVFRYFRKTGFQILIYGDNLVLKNAQRGISLKIINYDELLEREDLKYLRGVVDDTYYKHGAIDKTEVQNLSKKHNHSNKHAGAFGKKVGAIVLAGSLLLSCGLIAKNIHKTVDEAQVYITETQKQEEPLHVRDIGEDTSEAVIEDEEPTEFVDLENSVTLDFEDYSDTQKAIDCKNMYYDLICSIAPQYGLDPDLILAMATQERGEHSREIDAGGGVGLMQIQYNVWANQEVHYYSLNEDGNFEYHTEIVTDEMMRDLESNIHMGCRALQNCLESTAYNIPMAIQMYNQGYGSIHDLLVKYCEEKGIDRGELCRTPSDLDWLSRTDGYDGDPLYIKNVIRWANDTEFTCTNPSTGEEVTFIFVRNSQVRK